MESSERIKKLLAYSQKRDKTVEVGEFGIPRIRRPALFSLPTIFSHDAVAAPALPGMEERIGLLTR
jgi:hypothetical protein